MSDKPPLTATVALVEFDQGPGLRIDIVIGWDRLRGLAQQIRWWSRSPVSEQSSEQSCEQSSEQSSEQSDKSSVWKEIQAEFADQND